MVLWNEFVAPPVVPTAVFRRYLRLPPRREVSPAVREAETWAREWFQTQARPWTCAVIGDASFHRWVGDRLPGAERVAIVAVSAGAEAEQEAAARWQDSEPDRYYFLECYAAAVVDELLRAARERLGAKKHHCPGYPGWPIRENQELLAALHRVSLPPAALEVLESGMLKPKKSQLAVCALPPLPS